eukprot:TRINITY_DN63378_c0_g1_i1.p1 TRINITY_DN63378_c0_g1~~TRINITY_DN63378_c0_g1_i1.p1  ORF type:complete len:281 (+),score=14.77 TRINITY_DN63378_c0_g1_i1:129-845(+)
MASANSHETLVDHLSKDLSRANRCFLPPIQRRDQAEKKPAAAWTCSLPAPFLRPPSTQRLRHPATVHGIALAEPLMVSPPRSRQSESGCSSQSTSAPSSSRSSRSSASRSSSCSILQQNGRAIAAKEQGSLIETLQQRERESCDVVALVFSLYSCVEGHMRHVDFVKLCGDSKLFGHGFTTDDARFIFDVCALGDGLTQQNLVVALKRVALAKIWTTLAVLEAVERAIRKPCVRFKEF